MEKELVVFLGTQKQKGSLIAILNSKNLWDLEGRLSKIKSILTLRWSPSPDILEITAKEAFLKDVFGGVTDYGEEHFRLMAWHNSRLWSLNNLTESDVEKASALDGMAIMTRLRHRESTSKALNLNLGERAPSICLLVHPMVVKIPVVSVRYCLEIHSAYAFNSIRKAKHKHSYDLIAYLYEILFIQNKIAVSLHEFIRLLNYAETQKKDALFINAELDAIINADSIFTYLKASIEKLTILLGLTFDISNLDSKKTHKSKLDTLKKLVPESIRCLFYFEVIWDFISSDNLDELNNYRSGLVHKKGIANLQPHTYLDKKGKSETLRRVFSVMIEQHAKNTTVAIGVLAILTDKLVELDPPSETIEEILDATIFRN